MSDNLGQKKRVVFPDLIPENLNYQKESFYLSWPSWEEYRQKFLNFNTSHSFKPLWVPDPPNFLASLKCLWNSVQNGYFASGFNPFSSLESEFSIKNNLTNPKISTNNETQTNSHLILALWSLGQEASRQSLEFLQKTKEMEEKLLADLKDEQPKPVPPEQPNSLSLTTSRSIFKIWLELAQPLLADGDRLWSPMEDFIYLAEEFFEKEDGEIIFQKSALTKRRKTER